MIPAALCGGPELIEAAEVLGLRVSDRPELVLLDARLPDAIARAAAVPPEIPRVVIADPLTAQLLRATGVRQIVSGTAPELIGPALARALPGTGRTATRRIIVTAARGGVGRTLLTANLARHLARRTSLWVVDATGSGTAGWWLGADARPWSELEPITGELTSEHLHVVASEPLRNVRVLGGAGPAPSVELLATCLERLRRADEFVIVDALPLSDERTRGLAAGSDVRSRVLVLSYGDAASLAALRAHDLGDAWLIASQCHGLGTLGIFRALPRDDGAVAAALASRGGVGGRLGRAYEDLSEILAIDAT